MVENYERIVNKIAETSGNTVANIEEKIEADNTPDEPVEVEEEVISSPNSEPIMVEEQKIESKDEKPVQIQEQKIESKDEKKTKRPPNIKLVAAFILNMMIHNNTSVTSVSE